MYASRHAVLTGRLTELGSLMNKNIWIISLAAVAGTASAQEATPGQLDEVLVTAERQIREHPGRAEFGVDRER